MLNNFQFLVLKYFRTYASRPYENILATKFFYNENLDHNVAQRILASNAAVGRSNGIMYSRSPQLQRHVGEVLQCGRDPYNVADRY